MVDYPVDDFGELLFTDDLREAVFLRTQRLAARRNSPEGVVGLSGGGGRLRRRPGPSGTTPTWPQLEGSLPKIAVA